MTRLDKRSFLDTATKMIHRVTYIKGLSFNINVVLLLLFCVLNSLFNNLGNQPIQQPMIHQYPLDLRNN